MQFYDFENSIGVIINTVAKAFVKALDSELRDKRRCNYRPMESYGYACEDKMALTQKEIADRLRIRRSHSYTSYRQDGEGRIGYQEGRCWLTDEIIEFTVQKKQTHYGMRMFRACNESKTNLL